MSLQNEAFSGMTEGPVALLQRDSDLVVAATRGSRIAFEMLMLRHRRQIWSIVQRCAGSSEDAEDIVQQTFMKAFVNLPRFESRSSFSTWLISIARNEAFMWRRKRGRRREQGMPEVMDEVGNFIPVEYPAPGPDPETTCLQMESADLLLKCLRRMSPINRMAVQLCDLEEQSATEAALQLRVSPSAIKSRRSRARAQLRTLLVGTLSATRQGVGQVPRGKRDARRC